MQEHLRRYFKSYKKARLEIESTVNIGNYTLSQLTNIIPVILTLKRNIKGLLDTGISLNFKNIVQYLCDIEL